MQIDKNLKRPHIFFIPENKHHINFIVMFLYYFQLFIIHVNGCIMPINGEQCYLILRNEVEMFHLLTYNI
jgi:hypothetical protein